MSLHHGASQDASVAHNARPAVLAGRRPHGGVGVLFLPGPPRSHPLLRQGSATKSRPAALSASILGSLLLAAALLALAFLARAAPALPEQARAAVDSPPFSQALRAAACPRTCIPQADEALICCDDNDDDKTAAWVGLFGPAGLGLGPHPGTQAGTLPIGAGSIDFPRAIPRSPPSRA